jgi:hypothetical protein
MMSLVAENHDVSDVTAFRDVMSQEYLTCYAVLRSTIADQYEDTTTYRSGL